MGFEAELEACPKRGKHLLALCDVTTRIPVSCPDCNMTELQAVARFSVRYLSQKEALGSDLFQFDIP